MIVLRLIFMPDVRKVWISIKILIYLNLVLTLGQEDSFSVDLVPPLRSEITLELSMQ